MADKSVESLKKIQSLLDQSDAPLSKVVELSTQFELAAAEFEKLSKNGKPEQVAKARTGFEAKVTELETAKGELGELRAELDNLVKNLQKNLDEIKTPLDPKFDEETKRYVRSVKAFSRAMREVEIKVPDAPGN